MVPGSACVSQAALGVSPRAPEAAAGRRPHHARCPPVGVLQPAESRMARIRNASALCRARDRRKGSFIAFVNRLDRRNVPYLSHSKVSCLERCPRCYYDLYVLRERQDSTALQVGSLFHLAAKSFYQSFRAHVLPKPAAVLKHGKLKRLPKESQVKLRNAVTLLRDNHWDGHEVVSIEEPFFMDLAVGLPPIIGILDLVLRRNGSLVLVDHKTSKSFNELDPAQLILYAEHLRRQHGTQCVVGVFDEYRLVIDLSTIRKPAFRRTPVSVDRSLLPALIRRYRQAWKQIVAMHRDGEPSGSLDCWVCNKRDFWY